MGIVILDSALKHGRALEIVAIEDDEKDRLVVIHAMRLTKKYYFLLNEGEQYEL